MTDTDSAAYAHHHPEIEPHHRMILPTLLRAIGPATRIIEIGAGNGTLANELQRHGHRVTAFDISETGVAFARAAYPDLDMRQASVYDTLDVEPAPVTLAVEVIEHLYAPRALARQMKALTLPGGRAIITTPFHGYWKNLALAVTGKMDAHFTALWDHGHIKFFSEATLSSLLHEAGFSRVRFGHVGRIPALAMSMVAIAEH